MNLFECIHGGLGALWSHKLRSTLTLVGIIVGAASVVAMFSQAENPFLYFQF